jgi:hypothetical protein
VETGRLVRRPPFRSLGQDLRHLYVTPEVAAGLDGVDDRFWQFPMLEMEKLIAIYCAGWAVRASPSGDNGKSPDMERLAGLDEVWAMCAKKPRIWQVRILGRFAAKGIFVGLQIFERSFLGTRDNYTRIASKIPVQWGSIFGNTQSFTALRVEDYLGGVVIDVDQIQKGNR